MVFPAISGIKKPEMPENTKKFKENLKAKEKEESEPLASEKDILAPSGE